MTPADEGRPDPDALLASLAESEATGGRLKIFLGSAPGVGKTYEMLVQARRRLAEGTDVVAGIIETHGRAETAAQVAGLTLLPRRHVEYRGRSMEEFDLDAALERRPGLLLVDELAHTNVPGSRHAKRWEDVADLLEAGINVWATLNVQHLESLNDDIARITGVRPAETLPDRVLDMADEIELIDLPPADLRQRLHEGKIYRPDNASRALDGFFKEGNLTALREIALRRAAAHVDTHMRDWMRRTGVRGPWPASDNVIALIGADSAAEAVVRRAKRLADSFHAPWTALHLERPTAGEAAARAVRRPLALAAQLGADVEIRPADGGDLVSVLLDVANARNATHLVIGRARAPLWRRLLGRTLTHQLLLRAPDFVLHVVPLPDAPKRPIRRIRRHAPAGWQPWAAPVCLVAAVTAVGVALRDYVPVDSANMVYLAVVVGTAAVWGTRSALLAALLGVFAWDFFFIPPIYTVTIERPGDLITGTVFAAVAVLTGSLAGRARAEASAAGARIAGLRRITAFSRKLNAPATEPELLAEIARQAASLAGRAVVLIGEDPDLTITATEPPGEILDPGGWAAARWCFGHGEPTGHGTSTLPSSSWRFLPLQTVRGRLGVLGVRSDIELDSGQLQAMEALVDQSAVAIERVRLAADAARAAASEDTQRLRTALLASLGHDLRTPLTGIQGAAGTLRTAWDNLSPETRADLLSSIEEDVARMARFLSNITELTRLETGQISPRLVPVPVTQVVEAAIARLRDPLSVATNVPEKLVVAADAALLEQVLFNVLDNAVKYSPSGAFVRVRAEPRGTNVAISVTDEGVGIPPEDLPHVFDSFFRVRRGDRTAPGTGLGLAIARGLLEAMGGHIEAQSPSPDAPRIGFPGSVVTLYVPAAQT
jgi:two-component system, OmpR family, sensor histidine kinase KdpD